VGEITEHLTEGGTTGPWKQGDVH